MKNLNLSNSNNVRSKIIVEMHMKVHNECRNEERKINKEEFLSTLLQMFTEEEYRIYPNLTNDELMKNIKCINDIE
ncbi:surface-associated interspersed protein 8.1 (SURFIN 8.1), pseudogene (SURF8.1) [Plasmodium malariae]|nr:surface-associated interspersed protein 8.1 (SURFIN 8.1), pseudogene (SURF8.1) [Plasmodium malariae]